MDILNKLKDIITNINYKTTILSDRIKYFTDLFDILLGLIGSLNSNIIEIINNRNELIAYFKVQENRQKIINIIADFFKNLNTKEQKTKEKQKKMLLLEIAKHMKKLISQNEELNNLLIEILNIIHIEQYHANNYEHIENFYNFIDTILKYVKKTYDIPEEKINKKKEIIDVLKKEKENIKDNKNKEIITNLINKYEKELNASNNTKDLLEIIDLFISEIRVYKEQTEEKQYRILPNYSKEQPKPEIPTEAEKNIKFFIIELLKTYKNLKEEQHNSINAETGIKDETPVKKGSIFSSMRYVLPVGGKADKKRNKTRRNRNKNHNKKKIESSTITKYI